MISDFFDFFLNPHSNWWTILGRAEKFYLFSKEKQEKLRAESEKWDWFVKINNNNNTHKHIYNYLSLLKNIKKKENEKN